MEVPEAGKKGAGPQEENKTLKEEVKTLKEELDAAKKGENPVRSWRPGFPSNPAGPR